MATAKRVGGWPSGSAPNGSAPMGSPPSPGDDRRSKNFAPLVGRLSGSAAVEGGQSSPNHRPGPQRGRNHYDQRDEPADARDGLVSRQFRIGQAKQLAAALFGDGIFGSGFAVHRTLPQAFVALDGRCDGGTIGPSQ